MLPTNARRRLANEDHILRKIRALTRLCARLRAHHLHRGTPRTNYAYVAATESQQTRAAL